MTDDFLDIIGFSFFGLLIVSLLADTFCTITWNKTYFSSGLMIFIKRIPVNPSQTNIPDPTLLEKTFKYDKAASLTFKEIDVLSYGFREKMFQFRLVRYSPVMHGLLNFDTNNGQVIVKGFANWYPLVFSFIWLGGALSFFISTLFYENTVFVTLISLGAIAFFMLLMGSMYWIQSSLFSRVAHFAAQSWARKYVRDTG